MDYMEFLKNKIETAKDCGFIDDTDVHPILKSHQRDES